MGGGAKFAFKKGAKTSFFFFLFFQALQPLLFLGIIGPQKEGVKFFYQKKRGKKGWLKRE